ncbi:MAG: DUF5060 domain-containing protein, partial [Candidatus Sumerlaeota bacterium]|nr:DUF5060 domain-containing protein [Candidatus Sumerlaeota bacterium]
MKMALVSSVIGAIIMNASAMSAFAQKEVALWGMHKIMLNSAKTYDDAPASATLAIEYTAPDGKKFRRQGFWDGAKTWRARFMPDQIGTWRYETSSKEDEGLNGKKGEFVCVASKGETVFDKHGAVRVSENGRYFAHRDGTPFFWLADTVWNGALCSKTTDDWNFFLRDRRAKKFSGIQFLLAQWRAAPTDIEGQTAYTGYDKISIKPAFFKRMDTRVAAINANGLLAIPVLLWTLGKKEDNPGQLPEEQAVLLARYMVARYGAHHVIWILPGDGNYSGATAADHWKRIGRAVFDTDDHAPVLLHPCGMNWPYDAFLDEKWLSALGYQSGPGDDAKTLRSRNSGPPSQKRSQAPARPV